MLGNLAVDGKWLTWSDWTQCSRSCGNGEQQRNRSCDGPFYGGQQCVGPSLDERNCNTHPCPGQTFCNTHPCPGQTCCQTDIVPFYLISISVSSPQLQLQVSLLHVNMHEFKEIQVPELNLVVSCIHIWIIYKVFHNRSRI